MSEIDSYFNVTLAVVHTNDLALLIAEAEDNRVIFVAEEDVETLLPLQLYFPGFC